MKSLFRDFILDTMNQPIFIFDFDGTIANTLQHLIKISNHLSSEFNFKFIESHEVASLKNKSSYEIIQYLQIPLLKIPYLATRIKQELNNDIASVEPTVRLREVLSKLKARDCILGILSSNSKKNVAYFLQQHQMDIFNFVMTTSKIWSKNHQLSLLQKNKKFLHEGIIYIGDEIRDIVAAKKAGVVSVGVSWGYNSRQALQTANPDYLIDHPEELLQLPILSS